jgi:hypothetical protein
MESTAGTISENGPGLNMASGRVFYPFAIWKNIITIEDIAHGLAGKFRFAGLSDRLYTVAQHCVEVSRRFGDDRYAALWGLLHDAAEAWVGDVPSPIKPFVFFAVPDAGGGVYMRSYVAIEEEILQAVANKFGLFRGMPEEIHAVDLRERERERRDLYDIPAESTSVEPYPELAWPLSPGESERQFLERFRELTA